MAFELGTFESSISKFFCGIHKHTFLAGDLCPKCFDKLVNIILDYQANKVFQAKGTLE